MRYLKSLYYTLKKQLLKMIYTSFLVWLIFPLIFYGIWGILDVILKGNLNIDIIIKLFNAMSPWWTSVILTPIKFIIEYFLSFVATLLLVHHKILIPSKSD